MGMRIAPRLRSDQQEALRRKVFQSKSPLFLVIALPRPFQALSRRNLFRLIAFCSAPLGTLLLNFAIPNTSMAATPKNDFRLCTSELVRARVSPDAAADACSGVLYPKDLAACVYRINQETNIAADNALPWCTAVRRPRELAICVVNITTRTQGTASEAVLESCRRSLLPVRFSECVVGLNRGIDFSANQAMAYCIDGSDRPRQFYPPVPIPQNQSDPVNIPVPQLR
ncbi:MAG TPA: hypothetical protein DCY88_30615 [Cyanobacteria bacterium UBA11372]|nr:hypothetical protein [Cyanobacteria bacterium UBA11372]